jgi:hypothetical protein
MISLALRLLTILPFMIQLITVDVCKHGHIRVVLGIAEHGTVPSPCREKKGDATGEAETPASIEGGKTRTKEVRHVHVVRGDQRERPRRFADIDIADQTCLVPPLRPPIIVSAADEKG